MALAIFTGVAIVCADRGAKLPDAGGVGFVGEHVVESRLVEFFDLGAEGCDQGATIRAFLHGETFGNANPAVRDDWRREVVCFEAQDRVVERNRLHPRLGPSGRLLPCAERNAPTLFRDPDHVAWHEARDRIGGLRDAFGPSMLR